MPVTRTFSNRGVFHDTNVVAELKQLLGELVKDVGTVFHDTNVVAELKRHSRCLVGTEANSFDDIAREPMQGSD